MSELPNCSLVEVSAEAELKLKKLVDSGRIPLALIRKFAAQVRLTIQSFVITYLFTYF